MILETLKLARAALKNSIPKGLFTDDDYAEDAWAQHVNAIMALTKAIAVTEVAIKVAASEEKSKDSPKPKFKTIESVVVRMRISGAE